MTTKTIASGRLCRPLNNRYVYRYDDIGQALFPSRRRADEQSRNGRRRKRKTEGVVHPFTLTSESRGRLAPNADPMLEALSDSVGLLPDYNNNGD